MDETETDVLAYTAFPSRHRQKIASTDPIERPTPRSSAGPTSSGIFPNDARDPRLVGAILLELHNDWAAHDRRHITLETDPDIGDHPLASLASPKALASPGSAGRAR